MFKFTLAIATSAFLFVSSAADLFAMLPLDEDHSGQRTSNKASATISPTNSSELSMETESRIIEYTAFGQCMNNKSPLNLKLVCHAWLEETEYHMRQGKPCWKAWYGVIGHEDIYETFLNGVLTYRPNPYSDEGAIKLKISELSNPLEGIFDLSKFGDIGIYGDIGKTLLISTGYRKVNPDNKSLEEIWIAPHFLIEKKIATAPYFSGIMKDWNKNVAPVGVFFAPRGNPNIYLDYCTSKDLAFISKNNLVAIKHDRAKFVFPSISNRWIKHFMFIFEPK